MRLLKKSDETSYPEANIIEDRFSFTQRICWPMMQWYIHIENGGGFALLTNQFRKCGFWTFSFFTQTGERESQLKEGSLRSLKQDASQKHHQLAFISQHLLYKTLKKVPWTSALIFRLLKISLHSSSQIHLNNLTQEKETQESESNLKENISPSCCKQLEARCTCTYTFTCKEERKESYLTDK